MPLIETEKGKETANVRRNLVSVLRNRIPVKRTARSCAGGVACWKRKGSRFGHQHTRVSPPLASNYLELFGESLCGFLAGSRARSEVVCEFEQVAKVERSHGD